jgi:hypothetical protein
MCVHVRASIMMLLPVGGTGGQKQPTTDDTGIVGADGRSIDYYIIDREASACV